ncbi:MAG: DUF2057 family protein [Oceanobacter sp.]
MSAIKITQCIALIGFTLALAISSGCANFKQHMSGQSEPALIGEGAIKVRVPAELQVLSVGGHKLNAPSLASGFYWLQVPMGANQLIVQYEANWNEPDESGYYLRWDPVSINAEFTTDQNYELDFTRYARRDEVIAAENKPQVWLSISSEAEKEISSKKISGIRVVEKEVVTKYVPVETNTKEDTDAFYLNQLKILWQLTPDKQRQAFQYWLQNKENRKSLKQFPNSSSPTKTKIKTAEKIVF